jgi:hypothetical protein
MQTRALKGWTMEKTIELNSFLGTTKETIQFSMDPNPL